LIGLRQNPSTANGGRRARQGVRSMRLNSADQGDPVFPSRPVVCLPGAAPGCLASGTGTAYTVAVDMPKQPVSGPVLLFDGECGLCNRVVRFLLRIDKGGQLRFSPLQGPLAQAYLKSHNLPTEDFSTIVFVPDWAQRDRPDFRLSADGIAAALRVCGGWGRILGAVIDIAPSRFSDICYKFIARVRYRIFGPWRACPLPKPEWAKRFID
jgi:predicted DCC family thiol-disulfide oxidoreductase YuxK